MITISTDASGYGVAQSWDKLPDEVVLVMCSVVKIFPSSQIVCIKLGVGLETRLTEDISAYVLGCGEALRQFGTNVVLSTQAIVHLMKLPNLHAWTTERGPPQVTDLIHHGVPADVTSLFPSLEGLDLREEVALEWLSLFEAAKNRSPPWIMAGDSLSQVSYHHPTFPTDSSLISRFLPLTDLSDVQISTGCLFGRCRSQFTDEDVERLAIALPKLEALTLGELSCNSDTCPTTIRSLLFLSIHCPKLRYLNIHFRVGNLRADILDMLADAYSQGLHSRPKCVLKTLATQGVSTALLVHDPMLISIGMLMIFPSLTEFVSLHHAWGQLEGLAKLLGPIPVLPALTEKLMRLLNEAKTQAVENPGVPASSAVCFRLFFMSVGGSTDVPLRSFSQDQIARPFCEPLSRVLRAG